MSTIDDIGYLSQRLSTPESSEQYVLKGPTKSPPPIFMPKPVYAIAPTQKLVQQQLQLQQEQQKKQKQKQYHPPSSSPVKMNSPKPKSATTVPSTIHPANNTTTSIQQWTPQQQQQQQHHQASSSSAQQPQSLSINKPPNPIVSKVTFNTPDDPVQQHKPSPPHNHHRQQKSQAPPGLYPEYHEIVKQNEMLRQNVYLLTREKEKMEHERRLLATRLESLELNLRHFGFLRPSGSGGTGSGDNFSEDSIPVSPTHSRSAPTTIAGSHSRQLKRVGSGRDVRPHHRHQHHRSRSVPREDTESYPNRAFRTRSYDNYYNDHEGNYEYYSPGEEEEEVEVEDDDRSVVEEDEGEDWPEDEYVRWSRRQLQQRPRSRSTRPRLAPLPSVTAAVPRRPPPMHPGRYPGSVLHMSAPMTGIRAPHGSIGGASRNPDRRSLRHRHSDSFYRPPAVSSRWRGEYDEDYIYDSYDDDDNDYTQSRYRHSVGGASGQPRYNSRRAGVVYRN